MSDAPPGIPNHASQARWLAVIVVVVAILLGSLLPGGVLPLRVEIEPEIKHLLAYGALGFLMVLAIPAGVKVGLVIASLLAVLGLLIEILQLLIPGRSFMWIDVGASAAGGLLGCLSGLFARWFVR